MNSLAGTVYAAGYSLIPANTTLCGTFSTRALCGKSSDTIAYGMQKETKANPFHQNEVIGVKVCVMKAVQLHVSSIKGP